MVKWHRKEELVGKEVIDSEAKRVGTAKDLAWSMEGGMAIVVDRGKGDEALLPFKEVQKIADVIFIKSSAALEAIPTKECPRCKFKNTIESKYCTRCGGPLEAKD